MGKIRGACTVRVLAADPGAYQPWFATEYVPGPTLEERIRMSGPLAGDELFGLASGLAEALMAIHAVGVVHRDLKPANVILSPSGPRVVDLGIARALDEASVTRTGVLVGSPAWISPEHYRDEETGSAADIYAWGLLMAFGASGRAPYGSGRPEVLALRVLQDEVDVSCVPEELRPLVAGALSKDPAGRPSATAVLGVVTDAWRARMGDAVVGPPDANAVTALIERTWVMPALDDPAWALMGSSAPPAVPARRLVPVLMAGSATLAVVTAIAAVIAASNDRARNRPAADIQTGTPAPSRASTLPPLEGRRVMLAGDISAVLPTGWSVREGWGSEGEGYCLLIPGHRRDGCMNYGARIEMWDDDTSSPDVDDPMAWTGDSDVEALPQCFTDETASGPGITSAVVTRRGYRPLGDQSAVYREYDVTCGSLARFHPRVWWLPTTKLMMTTAALPDRYRSTVDQIADSIIYK
jgi:hypothetical protein